MDLKHDRTSEALRDWAARRGLKFTHIVLARGLTPSQPMLTRHGNGTLRSELDAADELSEALSHDGFAVTRVKIEVPPWADGVPESDVDGATQPPGRYFEHHVKLLVPSTAVETTALIDLVQPHGAHMSRNAAREREDGGQERFVTQRCYGVGHSTARHRLDVLVDALSRSGDGCSILEVEEEFVVYDTNLAIDRGWIEP